MAIYLVSKSQNINGFIENAPDLDWFGNETDATNAARKIAIDEKETAYIYKVHACAMVKPVQEPTVQVL